MRQPVVAWIGIFVLFFVVFRVDSTANLLFGTMMFITDALGLPWETLYGNYNLAFFGHN